MFDSAVAIRLNRISLFNSRRARVKNDFVERRAFISLRLRCWACVTNTQTDVGARQDVEESSNEVTRGPGNRKRWSSPNALTFFRSLCAKIEWPAIFDVIIWPENSTVS